MLKKIISGICKADERTLQTQGAPLWRDYLAAKKTLEDAGLFVFDCLAYDCTDEKRARTALDSQIAAMVWRINVWKIDSRSEEDREALSYHANPTIDELKKVFARSIIKLAKLYSLDVCRRSLAFGSFPGPSVGFPASLTLNTGRPGEVTDTGDDEELYP